MDVRAKTSATKEREKKEVVQQPVQTEKEKIRNFTNERKRFEVEIAEIRKLKTEEKLLPAMYQFIKSISFGSLILNKEMENKTFKKVIFASADITKDKNILAKIYRAAGYNDISFLKGDSNLQKFFRGKVHALIVGINSAIEEKKVLDDFKGGGLLTLSREGIDWSDD